MFEEVQRQFPDQRQGGQFSPLSQMERSNPSHDLRRLLEILLATQRDLSEGLLPRAARITGTGQHLAQMISRLEVGIRATQRLLAEPENHANIEPEHINAASYYPLVDTHAILR